MKALKGKREFELSDGQKLVLDLYRLKAKDVMRWSNLKGDVSEDETLRALSVALNISVEDVSNLPVPEFLPIVSAFSEMMKEYMGKVTQPDPN